MAAHSKSEYKINLKIKNMNRKISLSSIAIIVMACIFMSCKKDLKSRAEGGEPDAQFELAEMLYNRDSLDSDINDAVMWYQKAAEQGMVKASLRLAHHYEKKDVDKSVKWYKYAALQGDAFAQYKMAAYETDILKKIGWLKKAAKQGNKESIYSLAYYRLKNLSNEKVTIEDFEKALKPLIDKNDSTAMECMGWLYTGNTHGIAKNEPLAKMWFDKAANAGSTAGMHQLARMYRYGYGTEKNYAEALKWYKKAALKGDSESQFFVGVFYDFAYGVKKNDKEANKWYRMAADNGHTIALYNLGLNYLYGRGVKQDRNEAAVLLKRSADYGYGPAQVAFNKMSQPTRRVIVWE